MPSHLFFSKIGPLLLQEENDHLVSLDFERTRQPAPGAHTPSPLLLEAQKQLEAYFAGKLKVFSLPLNPRGTTFRQSVWQELQRIPWGQTASYKLVAERLGKPDAARAVGQANNKNPIAIIIPCHRVVGANGKLVGYGGGLDIKKALLGLEGCLTAQT